MTRAFSGTAQEIPTLPKEEEAKKHEAEEESESDSSARTDDDGCSLLRGRESRKFWSCQEQQQPSKQQPGPWLEAASPAHLKRR